MPDARGFTLIELLTTLAVAAILLGVAVPSYEWITTRNRIAEEINDFLSTLRLARNEAGRRGLNVAVCASANGTACSSSGDWQQGWIAFVDFDGDGAIDVGDTILRQRIALADGHRMQGTANAVRLIAFNRNGQALSSNGVIALCPADLDTRQARALEISPIGWIRAATDQNHDGVVELDAGTPISC